MNRLAKVDLVTGKCPYCKNYVDLKTGARVLRGSDGMVTVRVCVPCKYIEMAMIQAELKEIKDGIQKARDGGVA